MFVPPEVVASTLLIGLISPRATSNLLRLEVASIKGFVAFHQSPSDDQQFGRQFDPPFHLGAAFLLPPALSVDE